MDRFLDKWRSDKKYRAKIKLLIYGVFIILVSIYAASLNSTTSYSNTINNDINELNEQTNENEDIIKVSNNYNYQINIKIDDNNIEYIGEKTDNEEKIIKKINDEITNYIYKDNKYYIENDGSYIITSKEEVYDIVNYIYINLDNINMYLNKAEKSGNQYLVYLKDIILENDTDKYFVIVLNDKQIDIDYTPLMKEFDQTINTYKVNIIIEEKE